MSVFSKVLFSSVFLVSLNVFSQTLVCDPTDSDIEFARQIDLSGAVEVEMGVNIETIRTIRLASADVVYKEFEQQLSDENFRIISGVFQDPDLEIHMAIVQNMSSCQLEVAGFDGDLNLGSLVEIEKQMVYAKFGTLYMRYTKVGP